MKLDLKGGKTSATIYIWIMDSSSTVGAGLTGLAFNTASLVAYYVRPLGSATAITLATQTVTGAWSSGGFVEVSSANMPGLYRLDVPDAMIAAGVNASLLVLKGAANMVPLVAEIQLVAYDPDDTVRLGLTALPNASAEAAGGLYTRGSGAGQVAQDANGRVSVNLAAILGTTLTETAGQIAAGFKKLFDVASPVFTAASVNQTGDNFARIGAPVGASIAADIAGVQSDTDNLQTRLPAALVAGRMDASVGAMAANTVTASALATDAVTEIQAAVAAGAVASVTGAVGSVTGNVGGNVAGSVGSVASFGTLVADVATAVWAAVTRTLTAASDSAGVTSLLSSITTVLSNQTTINTNVLAVGTNVTTLLSRVPSGIFTGITSLAQWLGLLAGKQAGNTTARTEIRATGAGAGTYDETTDALEAIRDRGDAAWISGGEVQSVVTLSQVAAAVAAAAADTGTLTLRACATWSQALTGLGPVSARTKLYFTVKAKESDADTAALIQIEETAGLIRIAGGPGTANQGTLTVTDAATGAVTMTLAAAAAALLSPGTTYHYDVKMLTASGATMLTSGAFRVLPIYTRAVS